MIVNLQPNGWEIIYHRAHALLAAQIAGCWNTCETSSRLYETISAISHHDDLEKEWEGKQLTEAGAPLDFTLESGDSLAIMRRHAEEALYRGRWVAMLTSMHCCFLNQSKRDEDSEVADFLDEQYDCQKQWRKELKVSKDEALSAYDFMRWCDRLSLILCQHQVPVGGRKLEIITNHEGQSYTVARSSEAYLTVEPWPFADSEISVSVDACHLSQLEFESSEQLSEALKNAPRNILEWQFSK